MKWFKRDKRAPAEAPAARGADNAKAPTDTAASFENASQPGMELADEPPSAASIPVPRTLGRYLVDARAMLESLAKPARTTS